MIFQHLHSSLGPPETVVQYTSFTEALHPISSRSSSEFGIAWGIIKRDLNILTPPNVPYTQTTAASHSPNCNRITWDNSILVPLGVLERHTITASQLLTCIRITTIKMKAFDSFLKGFFVIEGHPHLNPHQNYRWCDSLVR